MRKFFKVLKWTSLAFFGLLLFRWGQGAALRERGYFAIGGEAVFLLFPLLYYIGRNTLRDFIREVKELRRADHEQTL